MEENENLDLEVKPAGNKDLWLFLIILDIIFLCVFGFFLYKYFSAQVFRAPAAVTQPAQPAPAQVVEEEAVAQPAEVPVGEPPVEAPSVQPKEIPMTAVVEVAKVAEEEKISKVTPAAPAPVAREEQAPQPKESILITANPKSKYRQVTFRWFGEGDEVSIVSGFTMSKPKALVKKDGFWEITLAIAPGSYKFLYLVDGVKTRDPYAGEKDGRSVVEIK